MKRMTKAEKEAAKAADERRQQQERINRDAFERTGIMPTGPDGGMGRPTQAEIDGCSVGYY